MRYTLKELRARKNETQQETAAALGITVATYNKWENDISNVGIGKVSAVAEHFGVAISEIFFTTKLELKSNRG